MSETEKKEEKHTINLVKAAVIIIIAAFSLEIFVFNFRSVQSLFYKETEMPVDGYLMTGMKYFGDGVYKFIDEDAVGTAVLKEGQDQAELEFGTGNGLDAEGNPVRALYLNNLESVKGDIHSIRIDTDNSSSIDIPFCESSVMYVKTHIRTCGNDQYEVLDWHPIIDSNEASKYIFMQPSGKVNTLVLEFSLSNGNVFTVEKITINPHRPIVFSWGRFLLILFVFAMGYALRPASFFWKNDAVQNDSWKKLVLVMLCMIYIFPAWILIRDNPYLTSFVEFKPYQELTHAISEGNWNLDIEGLNSPFDGTAIVPCLLFYLPFWIVLGINIPDTVVVLVASVFLFIGIYKLIKAMALVYYPRLKYAVLLILTTVVYFGCQMPFFLNQPDAYVVSFAWAEAMLVWALYFWIFALNKSGVKMLICIAAGSLIMVLIAGTRPGMEIYALLALPILFGKVKNYFSGTAADNREGDGRIGTIKLAIAFFVPFIPVLAGLIYYNAIRPVSMFDAWTAPFSLDKLFIGIYEYLFKLPDLAYSFPYLSIPGDGTEVNAFNHCIIHMEYIFSGLLPVNLIMLSVVFLFWRPLSKIKSPSNRDCGAQEPVNDDIEKRGLNGLRSFGGAAVIMALLLLVFDSENVGIAYRYEADFSIALLIASVASVMVVMKSIEKYKDESGLLLHKLFYVFLMVALAWSLIYHFNFYFLTGLKYPLIYGNTELYYKIYYAFY